MLRQRLGELEGTGGPRVRPLVAKYKVARVPDTGSQDAALVAQQFNCARADYVYMTRPLTAKVWGAGWVVAMSRSRSRCFPPRARVLIMPLGPPSPQESQYISVFYEKVASMTGLFDR